MCGVASTLHTISAVQKKLKVGFRTAKKLFDGERIHKRMQSPTKKEVVARRKVVRSLATKIACRGQRRYPQFGSSSSISRELRKKGMQCSSRTVLRDLKSENLRSYVRPVTTTLEAAVEAARVELATRYHMCSDAVLKKFVFVDECRVSLNDHTCRRQFAKNRRSLCKRERKRRTDDNSFQVFGAIGYNVKKLIILRNERRPKFPRGRPKKGEIRPPKPKPLRLSADSYISKCLTPLVPSLKRRILVQDGAKPHTANKSFEFLRSKQIQVLSPWPAHTPQLNCVENAWPDLHKGIAERAPCDIDELEKAALEAWDAIPQTKINSLCLTFRNRCKKTLKQRGKL